MVSCCLVAVVIYTRGKHFVCHPTSQEDGEDHDYVDAYGGPGGEGSSWCTQRTWNKHPNCLQLSMPCWVGDGEQFHATRNAMNMERTMSQRRLSGSDEVLRVQVTLGGTGT